MSQDFKRLGAKVREAREARGWRQPDLADAAHVGLSSVQNVEAGRAFSRFPASLRKIETALGWEEGSSLAILDGGESTLRRQTVPEPTAEPADPTSDSTKSTTEDLPIPVQVALAFGRLLDYDVYTTEVDGEQVKMISLAYTNSEAIDALSRQLEKFGEVKGYVRRKVEEGGDPPPSDGASDNSTDD
jgi:transcriptional regulator with XRE-family HTH domain